MLAWKSFLQVHWNEFCRTPFGRLFRLFVGRMFRGGDETSEELGLGVGAILTLLAMPGLLVSLLMFEKYGSLIRFLRGDGVFDPFTATIPDEYFFIVLSNFSAILILATLFTLVVNAASIVLVPVAVVGSQGSFALLFRFAAGHA